MFGMPKLINMFEGTESFLSLKLHRQLNLLQQMHQHASFLSLVDHLLGVDDKYGEYGFTVLSANVS